MAWIWIYNLTGGGRHPQLGTKEQMHLVLGSYDGGLIGLQVAGADGGLASRRRFAYNPHCSCVKAMASFGHTLVTTGTDERVLVYDLKRRAEFGTLLQHEGTVTCAEIYGGTHLLTGSDDKSIVVWRTKDWVSLSTLRGHKDKLTALAIHPSGKLTLASDASGTLYLWNLTTAKCVFRHRTPESSVLRWSPDGQAYASANRTKVDVSTTGAEKLCTIEPKLKQRVYDMAWVDDNILMTGGEDRQVSAWDIRAASSGETGVTTLSDAAKQSGLMPSRIKGVKVFESGGAKYCAVASAQGLMEVHDLRNFGGEPVLTYDTRSRLTCMEAVADFEGEHEQEEAEDDGSAEMPMQKVSSAAASTEDGEDLSEEEEEEEKGGGEAKRKRRKR